MVAEFGRRLKDIRDAALCSSRAELRFAFSMVADVLVDTFDSDTRALTIDRRGAFEALEIARSAAEVIDACQVIESCLFAGHAESCFEEFELPQNRSYEEISRFLEYELRSTVLENVSVYVVWSRDPERYLYIGTTEDGERRLRLDGRRKLFTAVQQGSRISLMNPTPTSATTASDVEAAIISVLECQRLLSESAVKSDKAPRALGTAQRAEIGRLLVELASRFQAPVQRGSDVVG
jgi:predicted GIY-YIG superfamily endonuclease